MRYAVLLAGLLVSTLAAPRKPAPIKYVPATGWPPPAAGVPQFTTDWVTGVAVGRNEVYVLQHQFPAVLVFGKDGKYLRSWGDHMTLRHSCRLDADGNLWVAGIYNHQVAKFTPDGQLLTTLGVYNEPGNDQGHFDGPADIAFGLDGSVYVADGYNNSRVVHFTKEGAYLGQWGSAGKKWGQFHIVHAVSVDAQGAVYVADRDNGRIQVFTASGGFLRGWKVGGWPYSVFVGPDQLLYVSFEHSFAVYTLDGKQISSTKVPGLKAGHMISVDTDGSVYFTNLYGFSIFKYVRQ